MRWSLVILAVLLLIVGYAYVSTLNGPITPEGRLAFVKVANPDMYPGHLHSQLLAKFANESGSKSILVVHFAGDSNYRCYKEGNVEILELAFVDTQGTGAAGDTNYWDSLKIALFGVPDGRYQYKTDGKIFTNLDDALNYLYGIAEKNGQEGPIPMYWHGTARKDNPMFAQGCGFPLFFDIVRKQYGIIPAFVYTLRGMIMPYFTDPYANFELQHATELQNYYQEGMINFR
ncbi:MULTISPECIES: hypothetical protein [Methanobacterium]|jgi:hypothetical protein|uniref:Uncharacterized protein n=1 Tax=Methanobacterium formicicum TaxID=2162 RepID=A0A090I759_METFO|nr:MULTISPECIES: hypothetical protein [Methanobacterium]OPY27318.1 MAG: hypothetical protein A4E27_00569 [Methanobacterium sp. PtaU1.Bin242]AIS31848.1 hypothetical protein BRM9_1032 [Methanobacterium formicicum]KUK71772.1 MAG: Uncharacterized protein XD90_2138 [Methanobacterium sp. 42_16]MBF4476081.1 hypothetical protein [Methanobacterium formicicum]MDG3547135.1 hypothetical protein [Methanobacterium formicicum]